MVGGLEYGTIIDVLTRENPRLRVTAKSKSLSINSSWEIVQSSGISEWKEFTWENLENGWGHLLNLGPVKGQLVEDVTDTQREIEDEDKVDTIAEQWNIKAVREAIKTGGGVIRNKTEPQITIGKRMVKFTVRKKNDMLPDMAVFLRKFGSKECLVMGDNKVSSGWSYAKMVDRPSENLLRPMRQITTYCMLGKTRYGYIMSDKELVACRVSYDDVNGGKKWKVECKAVPWAASGGGMMTINLAIWWLSMMSLAERYRPIKPSRLTIPINHWWEDQLRKSTVWYTHHLSGRKIGLGRLPDTFPRQTRPV